MPEANKNLVRGMFESVWNSGAAAEVVGQSRADDCVSQGLGAEALRNPDEYLAFVHLVKSVLGDTRVEVHEVIGEGDLVVIRATLRGATRDGRRVELSGMAMTRVAGGRITEAWNAWDGLGLQAQLGVSGARSIEGVLRFAAK